MRPVTVDLAREGIFISIAAYCDPLLAFTMRSAFAQASRPERLVIGLVEQQDADRLAVVPSPWQAQVRRLHIPPLLARGPCWARALAMSLYAGERWYLQIDSHTWFEPGWDERLIRWAERVGEAGPNGILSTYPNGFEFEGGAPVARIAGAQAIALAVKKGETFAPEHPVLMFEGLPVDASEPVLGMQLAAGFLFAPGRFVEAVPYDPFLYFHGEEQSLTLRSWTRGWDIWHPPRVPLYHCYVTPGKQERPLHWSPDIDARRPQRSSELAEASNRRLARLLGGTADLGAYGLGSARGLEAYARFSGIDYLGRCIEPRAYEARGRSA